MSEIYDFAVAMQKRRNALLAHKQPGAVPVFAAELPSAPMQTERTGFTEWQKAIEVGEIFVSMQRNTPSGSPLVAAEFPLGSDPRDAALLPADPAIEITPERGFTTWNRVLGSGTEIDSTTLPIDCEVPLAPASERGFTTWNRVLVESEGLPSAEPAAEASSERGFTVWNNLLQGGIESSVAGSGFEVTDAASVQPSNVQTVVFAAVTDLVDPDAVTTLMPHQASADAATRILDTPQPSSEPAASKARNLLRWLRG
jgi:hypothetical protein